MSDDKATCATCRGKGVTTVIVTWTAASEPFPVRVIPCPHCSEGKLLRLAKRHVRLAPVEADETQPN